MGSTVVETPSFVVIRTFTQNDMTVMYVWAVAQKT